MSPERTIGLLLFAALLCRPAAANEPVAADQPATMEGPAVVDEPTASVTDSVVVEGRGSDLTGVAASASEGATGAEDLAQRPILRSGEIVETIPGVIATQHSGGGKANQYFLRGFNLDHGTDLLIHVDGMQVNLPSHGHGQGYADLSFLIPELIESVAFRKGTYDARVGDFSAAGSTEVTLKNRLPGSVVRMASGGNGFQRVLAAGSTEIGSGEILGAVEYHHSDGPWVMPDDFTKVNALVRYRRGDAVRGWSLSAMGYGGRWNATDQIPARTVGTTVDRFGFIDPALGGNSSRFSLSGEYHRVEGSLWTHWNAYLMSYGLDLVSNFTYCLGTGSTSGCRIDDDQFLQVDDRIVLGSGFHQDRSLSWGDRPIEWGYGAELQLHDIDNGLLRTQAGSIRPGPVGIVRQDAIEQLLAGMYTDIKIHWSDKLRMTAGLRLDAYHGSVESSLEANSGARDAALLSPKLGLVFGPWGRTELYASWGRSFHSNDARGTVTNVDPVSREPVRRADPLVRADGAELGLRTTAARGLQSTVSVFWLTLDSELVFVGDAGTTAAGPPSRRVGVELANHYRIRPWLSVDVDATLSAAKFTDAPAGHNRIPGALEKTIAAGVVLGHGDGWSGSLRWRYLGSFPLTEDNTVRGRPTSLLNGRIGYAFSSGIRLALDGFNLLDRADRDIQYYYASRLPADLSPSGETEPSSGVEDIHFHPVESRTFRLWLEYSL